MIVFILSAFIHNLIDVYFSTLLLISIVVTGCIYFLLIYLNPKDIYRFEIEKNIRETTNKQLKIFQERREEKEKLIIQKKQEIENHLKIVGEE